MSTHLRIPLWGRPPACGGLAGRPLKILESELGSVSGQMLSESEPGSVSDPIPSESEPGSVSDPIPLESEPGSVSGQMMQSFSKRISVTNQN